MKLIQHDKQFYIIRVDKEEELIGTLKVFCAKEKIFAGWFHAIGAAKRTELAYFDPVKKKYFAKKFNQQMEIANVTGNIAVLGKEIVIHAHGVLGDKNMRLYGGHINSMVIFTIAEVFLVRLRGRIIKQYSKEIGLNIMAR